MFDKWPGVLIGRVISQGSLCFVCTKHLISITSKVSWEAEKRTAHSPGASVFEFIWPFSEIFTSFDYLKNIREAKWNSLSDYIVKLLSNGVIHSPFLSLFKYTAPIPSAGHLFAAPPLKIRGICYRKVEASQRALLDLGRTRGERRGKVMCDLFLFTSIVLFLS